MRETPKLILASASSARRTMLDACGVTFDVVPADIDEAELTAEMRSEAASVDAADIATALAVAKARNVSSRYAGAYVIGADQTLSLGTELIKKATTRDEARAVLASLRGRTHELFSAVALVRDNVVLWRGLDSVAMTMRDVSDDFLNRYLDHVGDRALQTVGCYELDGFGAQLFETVEGDYFTVLGMPLLPLLSALRGEGVLAS